MRQCDLDFAADHFTFCVLLRRRQQSPESKRAFESTRQQVSVSKAGIVVAEVYMTEVGDTEVLLLSLSTADKAASP